MITKHKKIHSGLSLWEHLRAPHVPQKRLTRDIDTDILVVGAGITGAMIADILCEAGFETTVVERRRATRGATSASTALVQYEIDTPLRELARKIGHRDAVRAWRRSRLAVGALKAHLDEAGIPSVSRSTLYLAGNKLDRAALSREAQARTAAGLETIFLDRAVLKRRFGIARPAALLGHDNLTVNPRSMTAALLKRACNSGLKIFAPVDVVDIEATRRRVVATTHDGRRIRCRRLVLATGYELPKIIPAKGHKIVSTWAFATAPQRRRLWPEECLIWEASDPYLYMRTTDDGRVICGGEDEEFSTAERRDELIPRKIAVLQRKLGKLFPQLNVTAEFIWASSFGQSRTGIPTIGEIPGYPNCWAALGYGGNGITYSRIAAEILRTSFLGGRDEDADLFAF